jgi:hypothetical protein
VNPREIRRGVSELAHILARHRASARPSGRAGSPACDRVAASAQVSQRVTALQRSRPSSSWDRAAPTRARV